MDQKVIHNPIIPNTAWDKHYGVDFSHLPNPASKKDFRRHLKAVVLALLEVFIFFGMAKLLHLW